MPEAPPRVNRHRPKVEAVDYYETSKTFRIPNDMRSVLKMNTGRQEKDQRMNEKSKSLSNLGKVLDKDEKPEVSRRQSSTLPKSLLKKVRILEPGRDSPELDRNQEEVNATQDIREIQQDKPKPHSIEQRPEATKKVVVRRRKTKIIVSKRIRSAKEKRTKEHGGLFMVSAFFHSLSQKFCLNYTYTEFRRLTGSRQFLFVFFTL